MKTNKSFTKRLKVRKSGKLQARGTGQNHFNAKEASWRRLQKKRLHEVKLSSKARARFLPRRGH